MRSEDATLADHGRHNGRGAENSGHIQVTWGNAISRDRITFCYDDPATALRDAWDPTLELWNNTLVEVSWHASHAGNRQREAESASHVPKSLWQDCACFPERCSLQEQHWAQQHDEIAAAAEAAAVTPPPERGYEGHLVARIPEYPGRPPAPRPGPDVLSAPRRGGILLTGRIGTDPGRIAEITRLLGQDLDGTVTVQRSPGSGSGIRTVAQREPDDTSVAARAAGPAGNEVAARITADPAQGGAEQAARARKLAADLRGTPDDVATSSHGDGLGEAVSDVLIRAAGRFELGGHAQGANLAGAAHVALRRASDNEQGHAQAYEGNARRNAGNPFGDLAADNAREARENAARLRYQAGRAGELTARPGSAAAPGPRQVTPGTGPLADFAAAARQLAADLRQSPVRGTYYSDQNFPDLVPIDTRYLASTELELAAARFDQGAELQGRAHLANARRLLNSRMRAARLGGWERLNDTHPSPAGFPGEAFRHANRAGMIEDDLNARPVAVGAATTPTPDAAASSLPTGAGFPPLSPGVASRPSGQQDRPAGRRADPAFPRQPGLGGSRR